MTLKSTNNQSLEDNMVPQSSRKMPLPSIGTNSTYPSRQLAPLATAAAGAGGGAGGQSQHVATSMRTAEHIVATIGARRHNHAAVAVLNRRDHKAAAPLPPTNKQAVFIKSFNQFNTANYTSSHLSQASHVTNPSTVQCNSNGLHCPGTVREVTLPDRPVAGHTAASRRTSLPLAAVDVTTPRGGFLWQPFIADTRNLTLTCKAQPECQQDESNTHSKERDNTQDITVRE